MIHSEKYKLKLIDWTKGFIVAFLTGGITALSDTLNMNQLPSTDNLKSYLIAGMIGGIAYITKNFLTNSQGKLKSEPKKPIL